MIDPETTKPDSARFPGSQSDTQVDPSTELTPEALEAMPEGVRAVVMQSAMSGPLPPPPLFAEYEKILPGAADRIISLAESEHEHRKRWENTALEFEGKETLRGQILGFLVSMLMLAGAMICAYLDQPVIGTALVGTTALGIVSAFIKGRQ